MTARVMLKRPRSGGSVYNTGDIAHHPGSKTVVAVFSLRSPGPNNFMCLLALLFRVVPDAPVVIGANREEFFARGGEPPQFLDVPGRAIGGRDPAAGGTWLGVNYRGLLVAV